MRPPLSVHRIELSYKEATRSFISGDAKVISSLPVKARIKKIKRIKTLNQESLAIFKKNSNLLVSLKCVTVPFSGVTMEGYVRSCGTLATPPVH